MKEPRHLEIARSYLGTAEIPGKSHNPVIQRWLREGRAWWSDDETPWCGTFMAAVMREAGHPVPKDWYRAMAWLNWGYAVALPSVGDVVIFRRKGGGHVGIVVGKDSAGRLMVIGGNQGNRVSIAPFDMDRVEGYRALNLSPRVALPLLASNGLPSSQNEA